MTAVAPGRVAGTPAVSGFPSTGALDLPLIGTVVLKTVSPCNLNCTYCYVYNGRDRTYLGRPPRLSERTASAFIDRLDAYCAARPGHQVEVCLHGGEPLMFGQARLRRLVEDLRSRLGVALGSIGIQTNATLVTPQWARLLRELGVSVSVSLDGPPAINDLARIDHRGNGSHERILRGLSHLRSEGIAVSVLCVVQPGTSGAEVYRYFRSLGLRTFDFLLPDVSHDDWPAKFGHLGPAPAADYLIPALDAWLEEDDPTVTIRFFCDVFRLILGETSSVDSFGGGAVPYIIVETDGSIQTNDALRVCKESLGETGLNVHEHDFEQLAHAAPLVREIMAGTLPKPGACRSCPEFDTCGGGYLPHRYSARNGFDNPSVWCADIKKLFAHMRRVVALDEGVTA